MKTLRISDRDKTKKKNCNGILGVSRYLGMRLRMYAHSAVYFVFFFRGLSSFLFSLHHPLNLNNSAPRPFAFIPIPSLPTTPTNSNEPLRLRLMISIDVITISLRNRRLVLIMLLLRWILVLYWGQGSGCSSGARSWMHRRNRIAVLIVMDRRRSGRHRCRRGVLGDDIPGVNDAGQPGEDAQEDVDPKVCLEAALEQDADGRHKDGEEVEEHVAHWVRGLRHVDRCFVY